VSATPAQGATPAPDPAGDSVLLVRRVFLTLLGGIFLVAFGSLWAQLEGLIGSNGILPAADLMQRVRDSGGLGVSDLPTFCWIDCSDTTLHLQSALGIALSLLLIAGFAPSLVCALLWALYLSLSSVSGVFLGYQWDILLLETGFLAIFLAPRQWRPRDAWRSRVPRSTLWLLRWLLLRLMVTSGAVKLLSGDPTWRDLTALHFHYFTQPLPSAASFFAHHLPGDLHSTAVVIMLAIEIGAGLLALGPRRARQLACLATIALMLLIMSTGNYGFFNLIAIALSILLLDDRALRALTPHRWRARLPIVDEHALRPATSFGRVAFGALATVVIFLSTAQFMDRLGWHPPYPKALAATRRAVAPLRTFNSYGLFAVMTTERPEILIEGRHADGPWLRYELPYKPGALDRAPPFVQPHMPRLDWQLWFAALRGCDRAVWFHHLVGRLLAGTPEVRALFAEDPFPDAPPDEIRSTLYRYRFADLASDEWWERERVGAFCPRMVLRNGRLQAISGQ
jgi:hypothetical protein